MVETERRTICWFSCGAASAVAAKLTLADAAQGKPPLETGVWIAYCETGAEHPDNERFLAAAAFADALRVVASVQAEEAQR